MTPRDKDLVSLLNNEWILLRQSADTLELSRTKCQAIGIRDGYTFEEQESYDSLTSKFARTSDIYIQKVIRTIWSLLHERPLPFIDLVNRCEKEGIIASADQLIEIRDLRNQIAHEYLPEALKAMVPEIFQKTASLIASIAFTESYFHNRGWIPPLLM